MKQNRVANDGWYHTVVGALVGHVGEDEDGGDVGSGVTCVVAGVSTGFVGAIGDGVDNTDGSEEGMTDGDPEGVLDGDDDGS